LKISSKKSVKTFFDEFSKQYEAQDRYKYLFYRRTVNGIIKQINKRKSVILDLGTGNGETAIRVALKFPYSSVIGIDISSGMINEARKKARKIALRNVKFVVSPMQNLKMERPDFVVSHLAFHHVKNKLSVITEIYKILPGKGRLIIGDWFKPTRIYEKEIGGLRAKHPTLARKLDKSWQDFISEPGTKKYQERHPREYPISQTKLEDLMKKAGFRKQEIIKMPIANFAIVIGEK
jgi:ubiquinone/menaquinone biosynthesis C-methylase UbiE